MYMVTFFNGHTEMMANSIAEAFEKGMATASHFTVYRVSLGKNKLVLHFNYWGIVEGK